METERGETPGDRGIVIGGPLRPGYETVLTGEALEFVAALTRKFSGDVDRLIDRRRGRRSAWADGATLDWLPETADIREGEWTVAPRLPDLDRRIVEITGPVDRKMIINALNSGADVFMADFEDATSPTWGNLVEGQINLRDAVRRTIRYDDPRTGKEYRLREEVATLMARPRGLHLSERHCLVDGRPVPGSLFDFGLYFFHNAAELVRRGSGPYFYLPKLESHLEARLWNEVFLEAQRRVGLPPGTIKATVLIETLPAAFEMNEILFELREHSAGLNCGRWDYIFSFIKTRRDDPSAVLPDRSQVTMVQPCMRAYTRLVVQTCHRRGVHAIGGMAAQIPVKHDENVNRAALESVRADKIREVTDGHDGTWVAHPGLVPLAREAFELHMRGPNQLDHPARVDVSSTDLLEVPQGTRTAKGLGWNVRVGVRYLESWLRGSGCVPLYNLMEDAATAEICRAQVWQWVRHGAALDDGTPVTPELVSRVVDEELSAAAAELGDDAFAGSEYARAGELFRGLCLDSRLEEFLTIPAYGLLQTESANETNP